MARLTRLQLKGKTLDEVEREERLQLKLDALEKDNHHEDPHSDMQIAATIARIKIEPPSTTEDEVSDSDSNYSDYESRRRRARKNRKKAQPKPKKKKKPTKKKKKTQRECYVIRDTAQDWATLIRIQKRDEDKEINYLSAKAPPSKYPPRNFCSVCGFPSNYKCSQCGAKFCSMNCNDIHKDTRCQKFVV